MPRPLLWVVLLGSCNQVYGLDETTIRPPSDAAPPPDAPPPDADGDGLRDDLDNCPGVANADQGDGDGDSFGDVCDFCPVLPTTVNHDEDADARGDECDLCPTDPDFPFNGDNDQVGDACDNDFATQNKRLLFDPFLTIGPVWQQVGTWSAVGDSLVGAASSSLEAPTIPVDGAQKTFEVRLGVTSTAPLVTGDDRFGIVLVDASKNVVTGCAVICAGPCMLVTLPSGIGVSFTSQPISTLILRRTPFRDICLFADMNVSDENAPREFASAHVTIDGAPKVQFRHVVVWQ